MSYHLQAIFADSKLKKRVKKDGFAFEKLDFNLIMIPLVNNEINEDKLPHMPLIRNFTEKEGHDFDPIWEICSAWSRVSKVMYAEIDMWAGRGERAVQIYDNGRLTFEIFQADEDYDFTKKNSGIDSDINPINVALKMMGVRKSPTATDEFETINLGQF